MPFADKMQVLFVETINLLLLGASIRMVAIPAASISPTGARCHDNVNSRRSKSREKQSSCLRVPQTPLPIAVEVRKNFG